MTIHANVRQQLLAQLDADIAAGQEQAQLNNALRPLAKWRSVLIQNTVLQQHGTRVWQGPLAGLDFLPNSAEGCHIAKLLGCYEQPLQPHVQAAMTAGYHTILNIGCAEGYYAVGMARQMPYARVLAFDLNPVAQQTCAALAAKNGVADRVQVGALFQPQDFAAHAAAADKRVLVFCDIEGAERDLLDPAAAPALAGMDIIVESHECLVPGITAELQRRFAANARCCDGARRWATPTARPAGVVPRVGAPRPAAGGVGVAQRRDAVVGHAGAGCSGGVGVGRLADSVSGTWAIYVKLQ